MKEQKTNNITRGNYIFLFVLLQSLFAVLSGLLVLYFTTDTFVAPNTYILDMNIGGLSQQEAAKRMETHFAQIIKNGSLVIKLNTDEFTVKYSDIGGSLDYNATLDKAYDRKNVKQLIDLVRGYFTSQKRVIYPVITFNETRLKTKLKELASMVDKEPVNANIYLKDDRVIKVSEVNGVKLNIDNAVNKIAREIGECLNTVMEFKKDNNYEIQTATPQFTSKDLEGADEVIAKYSTNIKSPEAEDSIRLAISAINKVLIYPLDIKGGEEAGVFSFNKYLGAEKGIIERNNEGYNQVASTLYAAVLTAGIKQDAIVRTPHKTAVDFIEPGLDTVVFGNTIDFKFKNTLEYPIVIFGEVKDNQVIVSLVSKKQDKTVKSSLKIEIDQKYDPPVINVENQDLQKDEERLVSRGKEGLKVSVYRLTMQDNVEVDKKLMYTDKYDAVESIVQVGPNSKWQNKSTK